MTTHVTSSQLRLGLQLAWLATAMACAGSTEDAVCEPEPAVECMPDRPTDYATLYRDVLSKRCGTTGNGCHGATGTQGGLILADPDTAHRALLGLDGSPAQVVPGDPSCSELIRRLETDDDALRMPRGEPKLPDGMRCALRSWIQEGAAR